jgi:alanyl-tRNA synthetase
MDSKDLRQKFLNFYEKKGHKIVPSSSLLPTDPSVLFTTAGMQQFKKYFLGEFSPYGNRVTSCQKCFRTSDIEEVGDSSHLTFLEMLGNFSFSSDYFKKEAIEFALELLTKELKIPLEKLYFTYFKGDKEVPADLEVKKIWQELGILEERIKGCGREDNFWGPTGEEGPCGPTTEVHFDLTGIPCQKASDCGPNCDCGRFIEIWNLVFNEYNQSKDKKLTFLKEKGVDTGMGLERLAMVLQGGNSVFETDIFKPLLEEISRLSSVSYSENPAAYRILADHAKGAVFLAVEGIVPSNVERGYILRRILRRAMRYARLLNLPADFLMQLIEKVFVMYKDAYPDLILKQSEILEIIKREEEKFQKTLEAGLKEADKMINSEEGPTGPAAFNLYQTYGFPLEMIEEIVAEKGEEIKNKEEFSALFKKHQEISRAGAEKKFKGGLADHSKKTTQYHTATHLLLAAMREILGPEIYQKGSNITAERLRFDFNFPQKLNEDEIAKIENLVNQKIKEGIKVEMIELPKEEALKIAKVSFDPSKYGEIVKVYKISDFSIELCGGPHVSNTSELGCFKIIKEESCGAGLRRIRAILE